jgi:hypothetical protein
MHPPVFLKFKLFGTNSKHAIWIFLLKILDVSENGVYDWEPFCYSSLKHILLLLSFMSQPKWFMAAEQV